MVNEAREELEKLKAKKKKGIPDDINEDDYVPILSKEVINKVVQWRLYQSDCLNKGYIIDNFPIDLQDARDIFLEKIVTKIIPEIPAQDDDGNLILGEGEDTDQPENPDEHEPVVPQEPETKIDFIPREKIMPQKVFNFACENETSIQLYLENFLKKLQEESNKQQLEAHLAKLNQMSGVTEGEDTTQTLEQNTSGVTGTEDFEPEVLDIEDTAFSQENIQAKLAVYKKFNDRELAQNEENEVLLDFFKNQQIEITRVDPVLELETVQDITQIDQTIMQKIFEKLEANFEWQPEEMASSSGQQNTYTEDQIMNDDQILTGEESGITQQFASGSGMTQEDPTTTKM